MLIARKGQKAQHLGSISEKRNTETLYFMLLWFLCRHHSGWEEEPRLYPRKQIHILRPLLAIRYALAARTLVLPLTQTFECALILTFVYPAQELLGFKGDLMFIIERAD